MSDKQEGYVWFTRKCIVHGVFLEADTGSLCGPCAMEMQARAETLPKPLRQRVEYYVRTDRNGDTHKFARPVGAAVAAGIKLVDTGASPPVPGPVQHDPFDAWPPEAG